MSEMSVEIMASGRRLLSQYRLPESGTHSHCRLVFLQRLPFCLSGSWMSICLKHYPGSAFFIRKEFSHQRWEAKQKDPRSRVKLLGRVQPWCGAPGCSHTQNVSLKRKPISRVEASLVCRLLVSPCTSLSASFLQLALSSFPPACFSVASDKKEFCFSICPF